MTRYKMPDAIATLAKYGFTRIHVNDEDASRLVTLHQDFMPNGEEFVKLRYALGKYAGNECTAAFRPKVGVE